MQQSKIFIPSLGDPPSWKLVVYSDASHANLSDGVSSMGAHIVFLVGTGNRCCPLSWTANKIKRVVRSTIAAEALSLLEGIEDAIFLRTLIEELFQFSSGTIPVDAVVDNKSVVEAIYSTRMVEDKRLRIDISAIKQFTESDVRSIQWCPGTMQLANSLAKRGAQTKQILDTFQSGSLLMESWKFQ